MIWVSEISYSSTCWFRIRWRSRSNGPSNTSVCTSYATAVRIVTPVWFVQGPSQILRPGSGNGWLRSHLMAILHRATLTPTKPEALGAWVPHQPWSPGPGDVELVGAFRFDDPDGRVGLEVHLVRLDGILLQVPFTYRESPLEGAEAHLVTTME